jgi:hypothetical protein
MQKCPFTQASHIDALVQHRRHPGTMCGGRGYTSRLPGEVPEWPNGAPC